MMVVALVKGGHTDPEVSYINKAWSTRSKRIVVSEEPAVDEY